MVVSDWEVLKVGLEKKLTILNSESIFLIKEMIDIVLNAHLVTPVYIVSNSALLKVIILFLTTPCETTRRPAW